MESQAWRAQAACAGKTDLFFPEAGDNQSSKKAKAICAGCPVQLECRGVLRGLQEEYGKEVPGVWAGTNPHDRSGQRDRNWYRKRLAPALEERTCSECEGPFMPARSWQQACTGDCSKKREVRVRNENRRLKNLAAKAEGEAA